MLTSFPFRITILSAYLEGASDHGLQDWGQGRLSEPRRWDD
jgi:hypothetical protein